MIFSHAEQLAGVTGNR